MGSRSQALDACDVGALAERTVTTVSGGERTRVALARVLAQDTPVLLLDEPTAALDLRHQEAVLRAARARADQGRAVLAVLHDLNLAAAWADRIVLLDRGTVCAAGLAGDVLTGDLLSRLYGAPVLVSRHPTRDHPLIVSA
jgi:iron complex transport system ATP-binding protein